MFKYLYGFYISLYSLKHFSFFLKKLIQIKKQKKNTRNYLFAMPNLIFFQTLQVNFFLRLLLFFCCLRFSICSVLRCKIRKWMEDIEKNKAKKLKSGRNTWKCLMIFPFFFFCSLFLFCTSFSKPIFMSFD